MKSVMQVDSICNWFLKRKRNAPSPKIELQEKGRRGKKAEQKIETGKG